MKGQTSDNWLFRRRNIVRPGLVWLPWIFVLVLTILLIYMLFLTNRIILNSRLAELHLTEIYHALELYELDNGQLPRLAFYPNDPMKDADSLVQALVPYGLDPEVCVRPGAHDLVREEGLSYLWNREMNRKRLGEGNAQWLLIDLEAVSRELNGPWFGKYLVLYTDGRVEKVDNPPPGIAIE